jgi:hypothetical protein
VRLSDAQACPETLGCRLRELLAPLDAQPLYTSPLVTDQKGTSATCHRNVQQKTSPPGARARDPKTSCGDVHGDGLQMTFDF